MRRSIAAAVLPLAAIAVACLPQGADAFVSPAKSAGGDQQQPSAHGDKLDGFRSFHGMLSREFPSILYSTESGGGDGRPRLDIRSPAS